MPDLVRSESLDVPNEQRRAALTRCSCHLSSTSDIHRYGLLHQNVNSLSEKCLTLSYVPRGGAGNNDRIQCIVQEIIGINTANKVTCPIYDLTNLRHSWVCHGNQLKLT